MLIVTEGVFSMDGDRAPLAELAALADDTDAWLMADDAHDLDFGNAARAGVPLRIGTLSKAIGAYGGYICASQPVIDLVRNRARTLIYTTGLPPPIVAASIAALDLIEREPERLAVPLQKARAFTGAAGLPQAQSSIVPRGDRRGAGGAEGFAAAGGGRLSRGRDPPADRAGRHRAAAVLVQRRPPRRRDCTPRRTGPHPRAGQPMTAFFITATGTEIGKTFVASGLIRHWRAAGRQVDALKPVATGFDPAAAAASDAGVLLAALGRPVTPAEIDRISPWRFAAPLSPDMAARRENRSIDFDALVKFSRDAVAGAKDLLLIEGIGGVMVPLDETHTVLDWMAALNIPLVLVAGSYLGSLSHTLTCLDVLARRGLAVKAVVVNETPGSAVTVDGTVETISNFSGTIPVIRMQRMPTLSAGAFDRIAERLET